MQRGDIYVVDFGVPVGNIQGGKRPALLLQIDRGLVVQNDKGNQSSRTTIIAAITTTRRKPYPFHVEITAKESGLNEDSVVMLEQLQTINQQHLTKKIGQLGKDKMKAVNEALKVSLGIADD
jgi:mRNA interferase MazF